jgi:hypothetical protein
MEYGIELKGGSIAEASYKRIIPCNSKKEAKDKAKRMNSQLSLGEKSYYKMKYVVVEN